MQNSTRMFYAIVAIVHCKPLYVQNCKWQFSFILDVSPLMIVLDVGIKFH